MVNLTDRSRHLFATLSNTNPPFYAMFFVIAGAELDVARIPAMGMLGFVYVVGRAGGKFAGARIAACRVVTMWARERSHPVVLLQRVQVPPR